MIIVNYLIKLKQLMQRNWMKMQWKVRKQDSQKFLIT